VAISLDLLTGKSRAPAECIITVDDTPLDDLYPVLVSVEVSTSRGEAAAATLIFETRRFEDGTWNVQDLDLLKPWAPVKIEAAFGERVEEVMRGFILRVDADYPANPGETKLTVTCQDESLPLDRAHVREQWGADGPLSDGVILATISGRHNLAPHPDSADGQQGISINQDDTDIKFLKERAAANGYELIFREGTIYFGPMRLTLAPQDNIMVYAGRDTNCINFSLTDDGHLPDKVAYDIAAREGDQNESEEIEPDLELLGTTPATSADSGLGDFVWRLSRSGESTPEEAAARALAKANENAMKITATGELDGTLYGHVLRVGEPVGVDGIGQRYGGIYYVDTVNHRFDIDGYRQTFTLLRNAYGDNLESSGGGVLSAVL
jgi:phage protein D